MTAAARAPSPRASEKLRDVDARLAEDRADAADDARHVAVAQEHDRPLRTELERKPVHLDDARVAPREERRVARSPSTRARERHAQRARVGARLLVARLGDREAAVLGDEERVDVVDGLGRRAPRARP